MVSCFPTLFNLVLRLFWCSRCLWLDRWVPLQAGFCVLGHVSIILLSDKSSKFILYSSCTSPGISHLRRMVFKSLDPGARYTYCYGGACSQNLSMDRAWDCTSMYIYAYMFGCMFTYVYTHVHIDIFIFMLILYIKTEFTPIPPITIQYQSCNPIPRSLVSFHICNSLHQHEEPGFHYF